MSQNRTNAGSSPRKTTALPSIAVLLGFAIAGLIFSKAFQLSGYFARTSATAGGFLVMATLVQIIQTRRGHLNGARFSLKRWSLIAFGVVAATALIEAIPSQEGQLKGALVAAILIVVVVNALRARRGRLTRDQLWIAAILVVFGLALASVPNAASASWLLILPIGLIAAVFLFLAVRG